MLLTAQRRHAPVQPIPLMGAPPPQPPPRLQHREQTGSEFMKIELATASQTHHEDTRCSTTVSKPADTEISDAGSNDEKSSEGREGLPQAV